MPGKITEKEENILLACTLKSTNEILLLFPNDLLEDMLDEIIDHFIDDHCIITDDINDKTSVQTITKSFNNYFKLFFDHNCKEVKDCFKPDQLKITSSKIKTLLDEKYTITTQNIKDQDFFTELKFKL